jgi:hypothetical protein
MTTDLPSALHPSNRLVLCRFLCLPHPRATGPSLQQQSYLQGTGMVRMSAGRRASPGILGIFHQLTFRVRPTRSRFFRRSHLLLTHHVLPHAWSSPLRSPTSSSNQPGGRHTGPICTENPGRRRAVVGVAAQRYVFPCLFSRGGGGVNAR